MSGTLDWSGALLATVALAGITFALIEAHRPGILVPLAAMFGVVALAAFLIVETRISAPMLPLGLFRSPNYLHGRLDLNDTIQRLQAYQEAGANVLYAPGLTT